MAGDMKTVVPIRLLVPFTGIDSPGQNCRTRKLEVECNNIIEFNKNLFPYLSYVHDRKLEPTDIIAINPAQVEDADVIFFGAPCQIVASNGKGAR